MLCSTEMKFNSKRKIPTSYLKSKYAEKTLHQFYQTCIFYDMFAHNIAKMCSLIPENRLNFQLTAVVSILLDLFLLQ